MRFPSISVWSRYSIYVKIEDPFQESVVGEEGWMVDDGFLVPEQEFGVRSSRTSKKSLVPCNAPGTDLSSIVDEALTYCEAQARVRQGLARDGSQGERPQSLNPCLELTLKLVAPPSHHHHHHPPGRLNKWLDEPVRGQVRLVKVRGGV